MFASSAQPVATGARCLRSFVVHRHFAILMPPRRNERKIYSRLASPPKQILHVCRHAIKTCLIWNFTAPSGRVTSLKCHIRNYPTLRQNGYPQSFYFLKVRFYSFCLPEQIFVRALNWGMQLSRYQMHWFWQPHWQLSETFKNTKMIRKNYLNQNWTHKNNAPELTCENC